MQPPFLPNLGEGSASYSLKNMVNSTCLQVPSSQNSKSPPTPPSPVGLNASLGDLRLHAQVRGLVAPSQVCFASCSHSLTEGPAGNRKDRRLPNQRLQTGSGKAAQDFLGASGLLQPSEGLRMS